MPIMDGHEATIAILKEVQKSSNLIHKTNTKGEDISKFHSSLILLPSNPVKKTIQLSIVAVTAYSSRSIKNECIEVGMKHVLSKPIQSEEVKNTVLKYFYDMTSNEIQKMKLDRKDSNPKVDEKTLL